MQQRSEWLKSISCVFSEINMYGHPWMTQRPMHPMQRFFWPHLTPVRPSFQPRFHPGPPRPPQEIDYFAFGDFRQARVSETSSEAAPPRPWPSPTPSPTSSPLPRSLNPQAQRTNWYQSRKHQRINCDEDNSITYRPKHTKKNFDF